MRSRAIKELVAIFTFLALSAAFQLGSKSGVKAGETISPEKFAELSDHGSISLISVDRIKSADHINPGCPQTALSEMDRIDISSDGCRLEPGRASNFARLAAGKKIMLNSASAPEFEIIPGIGARRAEQIIELRAGLGGFKSLDDLERLKWFSPKMRKEIELFFAISE